MLVIDTILRIEVWLQAVSYWLSRFKPQANVVHDECAVVLSSSHRFEGIGHVIDHGLPLLV